MKKPKIVTFDLETIWDINEWAREDRAFSMSNWPGRTIKANINSILCFGYQILGEKPKNVSVWTTKRKNLNDDYAVCKFAYDLLKDADAVITHNGKSFDFPFLQTRLKKHRLPALPKMVHIDTKEVASREYNLFSNRLKDLAEFLGVGSKISTSGKNLWTRIYQGDKKAEKEMSRYNLRDVKVTTLCALSMRGVIKNWPNANLYTDKDVCRACGSKNITKQGTKLTSSSIRQQYKCQECGTWMSKTLKGRLT